MESHLTETPRLVTSGGHHWTCLNLFTLGHLSTIETHTACGTHPSGMLSCFKGIQSEDRKCYFRITFRSDFMMCYSAVVVQ